jgi:hypothetical protein
MKPKKQSHKKNLQFIVDRHAVRAEIVLPMTVEERVASSFRLAELLKADEEQRVVLDW